MKLILNEAQYNLIESLFLEVTGAGLFGFENIKKLLSAGKTMRLHLDDNGELVTNDFKIVNRKGNVITLQDKKNKTHTADFTNFDKGAINIDGKDVEIGSVEVNYKGKDVNVRPNTADPKQQADDDKEYNTIQVENFIKQLKSIGKDEMLVLNGDKDLEFNVKKVLGTSIKLDVISDISGIDFEDEISILFDSIKYDAANEIFNLKLNIIKHVTNDNGKVIPNQPVSIDIENIKSIEAKESHDSIFKKEKGEEKEKEAIEDEKRKEQAIKDFEKWKKDRFDGKSKDDVKNDLERMLNNPRLQKGKQAVRKIEDILGRQYKQDKEDEKDKKNKGKDKKWLSNFRKESKVRFELIGNSIDIEGVKLTAGSKIEGRVVGKDEKKVVISPTERGDKWKIFLNNEVSDTFGGGRDEYSGGVTIDGRTKSKIKIKVLDYRT